MILVIYKQAQEERHYTGNIHHPDLEPTTG